jgi:hypothetical protein
MNNPRVNLDSDGPPFVDFTNSGSHEGCAVILDGKRAQRRVVVEQTVARTAEGNTKVLPPGYERFHFPEPPKFDESWSWLSVGSLILLFATSAICAMWSFGRPWWAVISFWLLALGSSVGAIYETWLIVNKRPYQLLAPPYGQVIQTLRGLIFAAVIISLVLSLAVMAFGDRDSAPPVLIVGGILAGALAICFVFRGPPLSSGLILAGTIVALVTMVIVSPDLSTRGEIAMSLTVLFFFISPFVGAETPNKSVVFHVLGIIATLLLALTVSLARVTAPDSATTVLWGWYLLGLAGGAIAAFILVPLTWNRLRSGVVNQVWPLWYLIIAGGLQIPRPERLGKLYAGREKDIKPLPLLPYYVAHPRRLTHALSVPCLDDALTVKVQQFGPLTQLVKAVFGLASVLDSIMPFANLKVSIKSKPRMDPWSDGTEYWPRWLLRQITIPRYGTFRIESGVQGPGHQRIPDRAIEDFKRGQLIAFLAEYGVAGPFLTAESTAAGVRFHLDFSFLEQYETKPDYEPYGGRAVLEIDSDSRALRLVTVRAPRSSRELAVDPLDATFRRAEAMILASIYFYVVSGKHLVEIHVGLNLVEVALHNTFDARGQFNHPIRMALYPHLFAHELAEELTTQHLLEDGSTFPQIFATTNAALATHLNDRFSEYVLHRDEDFDARLSILTTGQGATPLSEILPQCSLNWELKYAEIWQEYSRSLVDAVYDSDAAVASDESIQIFFANLGRSYRQPLAVRFEQFQTRAGLARFIADTLHHLIIRHEVYGTSAVRLALDPRISKVQVPVDGGPYPVDEWRSLACIAMATSRVRYTKLLGDYSDLFDDITDQGIKAKFRMAHGRMKERLNQLETEFASDGIDNYATMRLRPSELEIGAGY